MLQNRSVVQVVDNTEVLERRCFRMIGPRNHIKLGDLVAGSVKTLRSQRSSGQAKGTDGKGAGAKGGSDSSGAQRQAYKRGDVIRAVVINSRSKTHRPKNGMRISFGSNACVLRVNAGKEGWVPVGTRVNGVAPRIIRQKGWSNVVSRVG